MQQAQEQERRQQQLPKPPGVVLVGESFGGALALRVAMAAPEQVHALVLVNPGACVVWGGGWR